MQILETKSQLAKLLAEENLHVEHRQVNTASFDLKTRTLTCPIWKDMDGAIYDLLMGHEVGHALYTPMQGWHDALTIGGKPNFKQFLNVIEDARIEKKIKQKFPGLRRSFLQGYQTFRARDLFGIKLLDTKTLPLIDRLNLFAKGGNRLETPFTDVELPFVTQLEALETWDDVVALATAVYGYDAAAANTTQFREMGEGDEQDGDYDAERDGDADDQSPDSMPREGMDGEQEDPDADDELAPIGPSSYTEKALRENQTTLLSDASVAVVPITLPTPILDKMVTPYAQVLQERKAEAAHVDPTYLTSLYQDFMTRHSAYVSVLAKEFERTKAAESFRKTRQSATGDLNLNKLYKYRLLDEMLFKRRTRVYRGKSHGIVLVLDVSSSMRESIEDATEQLLVLALFCRKVQIPFVAYSFTTSDSYDHHRRNPAYGYIDNPDPMLQWRYTAGDLQMSGILIREIANTTLNAIDFREAVTYQLLVAKAQSLQCNGIPSQRSVLHPNDRMNSTPLNEMIVAIEPMLQAFRMKHHVEIAHLMIVQDGDSDGNNCTIKDNVSSEYWSYRGGTYLPRAYVTDAQLRRRWLCPSNRELTGVLIEWLRARVHVQVFGFYVIPKGGRVRRLVRGLLDRLLGGRQADAQSFTLTQTLTADRYVELPLKGYTRFCGILSQAQNDSTAVEELKVSGTMTTAKLATAFRKLSRKKAVNRVLATRLIPMIANPQSKEM